MRILVLNSGSSSAKFQLIEPSSQRVALRGLAESLHSPDASLHLDDGGGGRTIDLDGGSHRRAIQELLDFLQKQDDASFQVDGVGHRVVHGGETFTRSVKIDSTVVKKIEECIPLAPLHNPANLEGIRILMEELPDAPQVAVFDTAFHQTMPERAWRYAIPYEYYERHHIRRYGFHGTSHRYVSAEAARLLKKSLSETCLITAHLGNGCSACAVRFGTSRDTTMGLTPLEGLVMGTRSGDVDPNLHSFLHDKEGMDLQEIETLLNRRSGLLGLSEVSNDVRKIEEARRQGNPKAAMALDLFCYRLARGILSMTAALPRLDALVFTGGIGENSSFVRQTTCEHLKILNIQLHFQWNQQHGRSTGGRISDSENPACLVVPTNEELMIARDTSALILNF